MSTGDLDPRLKSAIEQLADSKAKKRESAARALRKMQCRAAGPALQAALEKERADPRTWSCQFQLILAIGFCGAQESLPVLLELARQEQEHGILHIGLGDAIFRLINATDGVDAALSKVMSFSNHRLLAGASMAMAMTRSVPSREMAAELIERARDPNAAVEVRAHPSDQTGYRKWVATAAADWQPETREPFLLECLRYEDQHLTTAAEASLRDRYTKWQPY